MAEVVESPCTLASGTVPAVHQSWFESIRADLRSLDFALLRNLVSARRRLPSVFFGGAIGTEVSFSAQLDHLRSQPVDGLLRDVNARWGENLPRASALLASKEKAMPRLADELWRY
ncbi:hypothetical protein [Tenggerimyces flavus]|uniref:Uncharacterized protein n=1 Tax=Tenggerimyces flavus TaxID=1708749 RepID=A0ABV7YJH6_9ACTN|nr:hypothetical protein [Tenggerimyces flavus]MBM7790054.1 hypothetical protein [Tenggerimyces flavus]